MRCTHCGQEMGSESVSVTIENKVGEACIYSYLGLIGYKKCELTRGKCRGFLKKGCPFLIIQNRDNQKRKFGFGEL